MSQIEIELTNIPSFPDDFIFDTLTPVMVNEDKSISGLSLLRKGEGFYSVLEDKSRFKVFKANNGGWCACYSNYKLGNDFCDMKTYEKPHDAYSILISNLKSTGLIKNN